MDPTSAEQACFEAGIKFGTLYHQFAGTPVSTKNKESLEQAIEEAIENQPFCEAVSVTLDADRIEQAIRDAPGTATYTELTGSLMQVEMIIQREETVVQTQMTMKDGYPLMEIVDVTR